jgi:hypothetical protein
MELFRENNYVINDALVLNLLYCCALFYIASQEEGLTIAAVTPFSQSTMDESSTYLIHRTSIIFAGVVQRFFIHALWLFLL